MSNVFEFYPKSWIESADCPIVCMVFQDDFQRFVENQGYELLTNKELKCLMYAFMDTPIEGFMAEVLETLRSDGFDECACDCVDENDPAEITLAHMKVASDAVNRDVLAVTSVE